MCCCEQTLCVRELALRPTALQYALTGRQDLLDERIGILEILSGEAVRFDAQIHFLRLRT